MISKQRTGFGLHDTRHSVARKHQRAIEAIENRPPMATKSGTENLADLFIYARRFRRPLAA